MTRAARLLDDLDAHRAAFSARLDALPDEVVHRPPPGGGWSLAQIADHLVRIDGLMRPEGRAATPLQRRTSRLRGGFMNRVISLPARFPVPPGAGAIRPDPEPRWPDVRQRWAEVRARWRSADPAPDVAALRHPVVGRLVWADALAFVLAHHRHHDAQVERTLRALGHGG